MVLPYDKEVKTMIGKLKDWLLIDESFGLSVRKFVLLNVQISSQTLVKAYT
jgi:hypothetical protein